MILIWCQKILLWVQNPFLLYLSCNKKLDNEWPSIRYFGPPNYFKQNTPFIHGVYQGSKLLFGHWIRHVWSSVDHNKSQNQIDFLCYLMRASLNVNSG
jgi:hypothetical protein